MQTQNLTQFSEGLFSRLLEKLREYRFPISASFLLGLLSYVFAFANKLPNHDDLRYMFGKGATVESGRWGLELMSYLFPDASLPWFYGIVTLALITCAICILVYLFSIRSHLMQCVLAGLIITFPSLIGLFGYMFTSSSFGVSFLLAVLSVYFVTREKPVWILPGILCCILSVSIYQAYIALTAGLLVLLLIQKTMFTEIPTKTLFFKGLLYVGFLILSLGGYWVITRAIQSAMGISMGGYAQSALTGDAGLLSRLKNTVLMVPYILFCAFGGLVSRGPVQILHFVCMGAVGLEVLLWFMRNRDLRRALLLLFLLAMLPLAVSCVLLFTAMSSVHSLVLYGFVGIYVLAVFAVEGCSRILSGKPALDRVRSILMNLAVFSMALVPLLNSCIANQAYLNLHYVYENTYALSVDLMTQVHMTPGYTEQTPVAILGSYPAAPDHDDSLNIYDIAGVSGWATEDWLYDRFITQYCGMPFIRADWNTCVSIMDTEQYRAMPFYPENGCVRMIDGVIAVKLPDRAPDPIR